VVACCQMAGGVNSHGFSSFFWCCSSFIQRRWVYYSLSFFTSSKGSQAYWMFLHRLMRIICYSSLCGNAIINTMCLWTCMILGDWHGSREGDGNRLGTDDYGEDSAPGIELP